MRLLVAALIMMLAFGGAALANGEQADLEARVNISPSATVVADPENSVSFLTAGDSSDPEWVDTDEIAIQAAKGVYSNNWADIMDYMAQGLDPNEYPRFYRGGGGTHSSNIARFFVEANYDVELQASVNFSNWMTDGGTGDPLDTLFFVSPRDEDGGWYSPLEPHLSEVGVDGNVVAVFGNTLGHMPTETWTQGYKFCNTQEYGIYFGFIMEKLTQVPAGEYTADITITVAAPTETI